jgi:hypothetical protein
MLGPTLADSHRSVVYGTNIAASGAAVELVDGDVGGGAERPRQKARLGL